MLSAANTLPIFFLLLHVYFSSISEAQKTSVSRCNVSEPTTRMHVVEVTFAAASKTYQVLSAIDFLTSALADKYRLGKVQRHSTE